MCYTEKTPMHLQITPNSPFAQTKTTMGVSKLTDCHTSVSKKQSHGQHIKSHANKTPSKANGAKSNNNKMFYTYTSLFLVIN